MDQLIAEWHTWCKNNNFVCMSADELFAEKCDVLTSKEKSYILGFISRWEIAGEEEAEELV